jgi:hypothetical protein
MTVARRTTSIILSVVFGLLALGAWVEVLLAALHRSDDPRALTALQLGIALTGTATAWGGWRRAKWTWGAAIAYGAITANMLAVLPSLIGLPAEARPGIWTGGAAVLVFGLLCAAYFRFDGRRQAERVSTDQAKER